MDGENNGSKPYEQMGWFGGIIIFGSIQIQPRILFYSTIGQLVIWGVWWVGIWIGVTLSTPNNPLQNGILGIQTTNRPKPPINHKLFLYN